MDWLSETLHAISQGLLYPVIVILLLFMLYGLFSIGRIIVEAVVERRYFKAVAPTVVRSIEEATVDEMPQVIENSGLLARQQRVLSTIFGNRDLPSEGLWALSKELLAHETEFLMRRYRIDEVAAKVAPMFGLMGTLIPLGPGVVAMSQGQTDVLASSLLIAFDTTVAGLIVAAVCFIISKIRRSWYEQYAEALEMGVTTLLEKIELVNEGKDPAAGRTQDPIEALERAEAPKPARSRKRVRIQVQTSGQADGQAAPAGAEGASGKDVVSHD